LRYLGHQIENVFDNFVNLAPLRSKPKPNEVNLPLIEKEGWGTYLWNAVFIFILLSMAGFAAYSIYQHIPLIAVGHVFMLGLITALRVVVLIVICSIIWVPIGVWIGLRPHVAYVAQPIAQFLAAFPANLLYPLVVIFIVNGHLNPTIWLTPLMLLGAQWYIVFNVIAGASQIPKDLLQVTDNLGVGRWLRWRRVILPGIFPYYITGALTAAGGMWNASIVAEVVSWGKTKLVATGLGSYISQYSEAGDFMHLALGIGMMCVLVLLFNRIIWRPLYVLAQRRYMLD
jgi:NitT/TauT family transport system permease protein